MVLTLSWSWSLYGQHELVKTRYTRSRHSGTAELIAIHLISVLCITMTIPAMATTTRALFGGAITAKLPKEYLDARWVDVWDRFNDLSLIWQ
jgi:hypothetical protein